MVHRQLGIPLLRGRGGAGDQPGRASAQMHHGLELIERFPALAAVFVTGVVDFRVLSMILFRYRVDHRSRTAGRSR